MNENRRRRVGGGRAETGCYSTRLMHDIGFLVCPQPLRLEQLQVQVSLVCVEQ